MPNCLSLTALQRTDRERHHRDAGVNGYLQSDPQADEYLADAAVATQAAVLYSKGLVDMRSAPQGDVFASTHASLVGQRYSGRLGTRHASRQEIAGQWPRAQRL